MMAVAAGALFLLAFLFAPRHGVVGKLISQGRLTLRGYGDDILAMIYRVRELAGERAAVIKIEDLRNALKAGRWIGLVLLDLSRQKLVRRTPDGVGLTESGLQAAASLIRSHRLWESYLCDRMGFCDAEGHYAGPHGQ